MSEAGSAVDGRHARSQQSQAKLADALLDLLAEGNVRPSSAQIAERAGVTQRTLFNQFGDVESLLHASSKRLIERVVPLLPHAGTGSLDQRVATFAVQLATCLELLMPIRHAALMNSRDEGSSSEPRLFARALRDLFVEGFGPEIDGLDASRRAQLLDDLDAVCTPLAWRVRRVEQRLDVSRATAGLERTIAALLRDATGDKASAAS
jgi:AcrR family transcriptional regulator